jgi:tripartite-type tricarboxylate transporter receptor subunit TctC
LEWPTRSITIQAPAAPGGGTDLSARLTAKYMEKFLGKPIVIVNTTGAAGGMAASAVRQSFRLYAKFAALAHTYPLVCLMYSIFLYYKELVKSYLPTVTHDISCLFTRACSHYVESMNKRR